MVTIYTDGGCHSSTKTGGWAAVVKIDGEVRGVNLSGAERNTTNNRMELMGAIKGLEFAKSVRPGEPVSVTSDSKYVVDGITSWVNGWKAKGWLTSQQEPVINRDLWEILDSLNQEMNVTWSWVKGHAGNEYNELCDKLTQTAIARIDKPDTVTDVTPGIVVKLKEALTKELFKASSVTVGMNPVSVEVKNPKVPLDFVNQTIKNLLIKEDYEEPLPVRIELKL